MRAAITATDDEEVRRVCDAMHVLEKQIEALPALCGQDFTAKVAALTTFGDYDLEHDSETVLADARALLGAAL